MWLITAVSSPLATLLLRHVGGACLRRQARDLEWSDNFAPVGGTGPSAFAIQGARAVAADGGRVFVVGSGINASSNADFIVRTYDAK